MNTNLQIHRCLFAFGLLLHLLALTETVMLVNTHLLPYGCLAMALCFWFYGRMLNHIERIHRTIAARKQLQDNLAKMPRLEMRHVKERGITYRKTYTPKMRVKKSN